jgi:hypothetical protein
MIGKRPMYRIETVRAWLSAQERRPSPPQKSGRVTGQAREVGDAWGDETQ